MAGKPVEWAGYVPHAKIHEINTYGCHSQFSNSESALMLNVVQEDLAWGITVGGLLIWQTSMFSERDKQACWVGGLGILTGKLE